MEVVGLGVAGFASTSHRRPRILVMSADTDPAKREMFDRLANHLSTLADQVEEAMIRSKTAPE